MFKDQDKDLSSKDKDKDKDCIVKDKDQDKDCILVLKESLRTRKRTNITVTHQTVAISSESLPGVDFFLAAILCKVPRLLPSEIRLRPSYSHDLSLYYFLLKTSIFLSD